MAEAFAAAHGIPLRRSGSLALAGRGTVAGEEVWVAEPLTMMNRSGAAIRHLLRESGGDAASLVVVHDDLDLPLGAWKLQFAKGPKDHGGINDIEQKLRTNLFTRIRVGVDNRKPESRIMGEEYVLQDFTDAERKILDKVIDEICKKLATS